MSQQYTIKSTSVVPALDAKWEAEVWKQANPGSIENHVRSDSGYYPRSIEFRLLHDEEALYGIFRVQERYVRSVMTQFQDSVCRDSCCEIFFQPSAKGYFNLEMNAGGTFLLYYIRDCTICNGTFKDLSQVTKELGQLVSVKTSLPKVVEPEIEEETVWTVQFVFPRSVMEVYAGPLGQFSGQNWKGNLYKCGELTSHPNWVCWNPIPVLCHHLPECYAPLILE